MPEVHGSDEREGEPVDLDRLCGLASSVLSAEGVGDAVEVTLLLVDEAEMALLNQAHRSKVGPTDVLSFTIDDLDGPDDQLRLLGDIVICPSVASGNADDHGVSLEAELELLVVHGCLHLLGWDHEVDEEAEAMEAREAEHLARFGTADRSAR